MIFEVLQQVLNEFFVDVQEDNVSFYAGDLFGQLLPFYYKVGLHLLIVSFIGL